MVFYRITYYWLLCTAVIFTGLRSFEHLNSQLTYCPGSLPDCIVTNCPSRRSSTQICYRILWKNSWVWQKWLTWLVQASLNPLTDAPVEKIDIWAKAMLILECCVKLIVKPIKVLSSNTGACKNEFTSKSLITESKSRYLKPKRGILWEKQATWTFVTIGLCGWWIFLSRFQWDCRAQWTTYELVCWWYKRPIVHLIARHSQYLCLLNCNRKATAKILSLFWA